MNDRPIDEKYWDLKPEQIASMDRDERQQYYWDMYQHAGGLIGVLIDLGPNDDADDRFPGMSSAEYFAYSAANNAHSALLDALAALNDILDEDD